MLYKKKQKHNIRLKAGWNVYQCFEIPSKAPHNCSVWETYYCHSNMQKTIVTLENIQGAVRKI